MDVPVFCSQKHNAAKCMRWAILAIPLLFTGCFDTQSASKTNAQKTGISAISRYFSFNQASSPEKAKEGVVSTDTLALPGIASESPDFDQKAAELGVAMPSFIEVDRARSNVGFTGGKGSIADLTKFMRRRDSNSKSSAAILDASFDQLFASVFGPVRTDGAALFANDEPPNPFTEAKQKQESSANSQSSDTKSDAAANKSQTKKQASNANDSKPDSNGSQTIIPGSATPASSRFLMIGDFDGSGVLRTAYADRLSPTRFASDDGTRDFNLYINPAAVEQQRSFGVDDIDADGYSDLLVTSRASLFGGVFLGGTDGEYRYADKFLTGYEPIVPAAGPLSSGMREILTVNMRSGSLTRFRSVEHYRPFQTERLSFLPTYVLRMFSPETSLDYLMAVQSGITGQILKWGNGLLEPAEFGLNEDATVLSADYGSCSVRAYQVGSYASIVLSAGGSSFNVANMRVSPKIFLVIGDLQQQGFKDVAIANLMLFTPKSNR